VDSEDDIIVPDEVEENEHIDTVPSTFIENMNNQLKSASKEEAKSAIMTLGPAKQSLDRLRSPIGLRNSRHPTPLFSMNNRF
jgi:hypothetical protein